MKAGSDIGRPGDEERDLPRADPARTVVVVVGIDTYDAGDDWTLKGPADDALRFARWFRERGVPAANIIAHVASHPPESQGWAELGIVPHPATHESIRSTFVRTLPAREGDLLWTVWGGHGIVDEHGRRRVFYADALALDRLNLDVEHVLTYFRSTAVPSFPSQIWIFDACQNLRDGSRARRDLPEETFGADRTLTVRAQAALFAARPGEVAANLTAERSGLYSRELLEILRTTPELWPPDLVDVVNRQRDRFYALRREGRSAQTPIHFWFRSADGDEGQVLREVEAQPAVDATRARLSLEDTSTIVELLLRIPEFAQPRAREEILGGLSGDIFGAIARHAQARLETVSVVTTSRRFPGGLQELAQAVVACAGISPETTRLTDAIDEMITRYGI